MADAFQTISALLAQFPDAIGRERSKHNAARGNVSYQALRNLLQTLNRASTQGLSRLETGGAVMADGTTGATIAIYTTNLPAAEVVVCGVHLRRAASVDDVLQGAGLTITSYDLAGAVPVVIANDGDSARVAIVAIIVNGAVELRAVWGATDADAAELDPTSAQIITALAAAAIPNHEPECGGLIVWRGKYARAGGAITVTGTDPSTDDALRAEQIVSTLNGLVA
jgi:hypothetical protein